jgi:queuine/archaeosine tRNA-ribosyltransferase
MVGAASLFLVIPVGLSEEMNWETGFYTGEGGSISRSYERAAATGTEGQGFDALRSGDGVKLEDFQKAYIGTSMGSEASDGWDVFRVGEGDPLP